jgi:hypothetical protein
MTIKKKTTFDDNAFETSLKKAALNGGKSSQRKEAFDLLDRHYAAVSDIIQGSSRAGWPTVKDLIVESGGPAISVKTLKAAWNDLEAWRAEMAREAHTQSKKGR